MLSNKQELLNQSVIIACPICKAKKFIFIPQNILKPNGLTTISIPKDSICEHHFQFYIDNDLKVRGYQKVDYELKEGIIETDFNCQLCNAKIKFRIDDENSYIEMISQNIFFGKEFFLYKVAHYYKNELHINNVFVDKTGRFYDQLSSSRLKIEEYDNKELGGPQKFYRYSGLKQEALTEHSMFNLFMIFNIYEHWIYDLVSATSINTFKLTNLLYEKIQEAKKIYSENQKNLKFSIADQDYQLRFLNSNVICYNIKNNDHILWFNSLLDSIADKEPDTNYLVTKSSRFLMINEYFDEKKIYMEQVPMILRLINDDLLFSKVQIKYKDRVPSIINRLETTFEVNKEILDEFFNQELSIVDFLSKKGIQNQLEQFIEMYDFINRRKLLE